jgi:hypothetical protein
MYEVSLWKITTGMKRGPGLVFDIDMRCPAKKDGKNMSAVSQIAFWIVIGRR